MKRIILRIFKSLITSLILSSCAHHSLKQNYKIQSPLSEVIIMNTQGEVIGATPIELTKEQLQKLQLGENHYQFLARKEGFIDGQFSLVLSGPTTIKISLQQLNKEHFNKWVLKKYSNETNKMLKDILEIQSLVFSTDRAQLENRIIAFNQNYQNLAPAYTLQGSVLLRQGKLQEAHESLIRALSIDPEDLTAKRLVEEIERGNK